MVGLCDFEEGEGLVMWEGRGKTVGRMNGAS